MAKIKENKKMMILSFFGIIFVVLGHTTSSIDMMGNYFPFYSFHMALFIFISGYFYKATNEDNLLKKDGYILKKVKKLVIPYFGWNLIYGILINIARTIHLVDYGEKISMRTLFIDPWKWGSQFHLNIASWFLLALFLVNITYVLIRKLLKRVWNDYVALFVFLILSCIAIKFSKNIPNVPLFALFRTCFFMFFYHLGYIYKIKFEDRIKTNNSVYLILLIFIQVILIKMNGNIIYMAIFMKFNTKYIIAPIISSVTGILFWLKVSEILVPSLKDSKVVNDISNNTFSIMMHHLFWIFAINTVLYKLSGPLHLSGFNVEMYKNTIYYSYTGGIYISSIFYSIAVIFLPICCLKLRKKLFR